jgi:hypothetical protein
MANGERTEFHSKRRVDRAGCAAKSLESSGNMYAYRDKFDAALGKHMQGDSSNYAAHLKSEGFLTPSGKTTGAGRLNPMARTELNWDK